MSKMDKYCEICKEVLGLRHAMPHPEYGKGAVYAIVELYKVGLVKRNMRHSEEKDLMGLCMRALNGYANPRTVLEHIKEALSK